MKKIVLLIILIAAATLLPAQDVLLKNADIYTFDRGVLKGYDLLVRKGKIAEIKQNIPVNSTNKKNKNVNVIDLTGKAIIPGIIDSHTHIGLLSNSNEYTTNVAAGVKMEYQLNPDDPRIFYCLSAGVTMGHTMHGSANPIGGESAVIKMKWGKSTEEMLERRALRTLKMALGENVKSTENVFPTTRPGVSEVIEKAYLEAIEYRRTWKEYRQKIKQTPKKERFKVLPPKKDLCKEALLETLDNKVVIRCHSYRADETLNLIRLSKKLGFKIAAFEHMHQAYRIADELKAENIPISIFVDSWNYKVEASEYSPWGYKLLHEKGVEISINSDGFNFLRRLNTEAGKMRRYAGMTDLEALKTITLFPAKMLGVDEFTGSIEVGKEADLAVFDNHPLSPTSKCVLTLIEGEIYFQRSKAPFAGGKKTLGLLKKGD